MVHFESCFVDHVECCSFPPNLVFGESVPNIQIALDQLDSVVCVFSPSQQLSICFGRGGAIRFDLRDKRIVTFLKKKRQSPPAVNRVERRGIETLRTVNLHVNTVTLRKFKI